MRSKNYVIVPLLAATLGLAMTGCDLSGAASDSSDRSTAKSAKTSEKAVEEGLLPQWAPAGGTNVELMQRNSGAERIFVMDYDGKVDSDQCSALKTVGKPTDDELAAAYASDERVKNFKPEDISKTRTLQAQWWPENAEQKTTDLCGRFWVHQEAGKLYAFAPDTVTTVNGIMEERAQVEKESTK